jgi:transposase
MRSFGTEISGNRPINAELSEAIRGAIIHSHESHEKPSQIASRLGISRSTVYNTINRFQTTGNLRSKPRTGRPSKLTPSERRYLFLVVHRNPIISYKALIHEANLRVSKSTIRRVLKKLNIRKWISKKRIFLKQHDAKKRLEFVKKWSNCNDFSNIIFSDECSVQRKSNSIHQYAFSFKYERYRKDLVNLVNHGKDLRQMV